MAGTNFDFAIDNYVERAYRGITFDASAVALLMGNRPPEVMPLGVGSAGVVRRKLQTGMPDGIGYAGAIRNSGFVRVTITRRYPAKQRVSGRAKNI